MCILKEKTERKDRVFLKSETKDFKIRNKRKINKNGLNIYITVNSCILFF
jgi:hypothetical protein